jgi:hypothetical protein
MRREFWPLPSFVTSPLPIHPQDDLFQQSRSELLTEASITPTRASHLEGLAPHWMHVQLRVVATSLHPRSSPWNAGFAASRYIIVDSIIVEIIPIDTPSRRRYVV